VRSAQLQLAAAPDSIVEARHFVGQALGDVANADSCWAAAQVVSELATNALVHARTPFVVSVAVEDAIVRIAVTDWRPSVTPSRGRASRTTATGRGLALVDSLVLRWGVDTGDETKTVWCELPRAAGST